MCNILSNCNDNESTKITEQNLETTLFLPQRRENVTNFQPFKNSHSASAEDRGVTKQELTEFLKFIQNTIQTLTAFEKRFYEQ